MGNSIALYPDFQDLEEKDYAVGTACGFDCDYAAVSWIVDGDYYPFTGVCQLWVIELCGGGWEKCEMYNRRV